MRSSAGPAAALLLACTGGGGPGAAPGVQPAPASPTSPTPPASAPSFPRWPDPPPTPPAECLGLLPGAPGPGRDHGIDVSGLEWFCREPIIDGTGDWIGLGVGLKQSYYEMVSSRTPGGPVNAFQLPLARERNEQTVPLAPQPAGYHAIFPGDVAPGPFRRYDAEGHLVSEGGTLGGGVRIRSAPGGGSAVATEQNDPAVGLTTYRLEVMDGSGARRGAAELGRPTVNHAVSTSGHVLVLGAALPTTDDGVARWYDADARPLTPWFPVPRPAGWLVDAQLFPLADGSIGLASGAWPVPRTWRLLFRDGEAHVSGLPGWLEQRPFARAFVVRGGRANALVPVGFPEASPGPVPCAPFVEILTPSGQSCGVVGLDAGACTTLFVGVEGTVIAQARTATGACRWRWWAGLLR